MSYDAWKEAAPEEDGEPPTPCCVCTGDADAPPCGEDCDALMRRCRRDRIIRGHYEDARRALRLAREYRIGDHSSDLRVRTILRRVYFIRQDIADVRRSA